MSAEIVLSIFTGEYVSQSAMSMYQVILIQYHPSILSYFCHLELWEEKQAVPIRCALPWCCCSYCTDSSGAAGEGHPNTGDKP